ncbi:MAG: Spy/CpxP family protein refolding chaperone [Woeseiaceae bacterium]|nr:Spy/CpxP family protein refolding chaperone [Woeseiaceae bacterium]MDX2608581.1 Spy/CpxP family protein refolding chaperone [Woeseiaceae bacterium]
MNTRKAGLLAFVTVAMLATIAYAGGNDGRPGPGRHGGGPGFGMPDPGMMIGRMAEHLDLDDVQRESVKNIMEAAKPELKALREQFSSNREALQALDAGDPEVQNIAISNGQLATEGTLLFSRIRGEIHAVLTDEQLAKAAELKDQRKERGERRKDRR